VRPVRKAEWRLELRGECALARRMRSSYQQLDEMPDSGEADNHSGWWKLPPKSPSSLGAQERRSRSILNAFCKGTGSHLARGLLCRFVFVLPLFACDLPATVLAAREVGANAGSRPGDWLQDPRLPIRHRSTRDENNSYVHSARGIARSGADVFRANALAVNTS